ncbi:MAG: outer membrane beta-barrel protein [Emticicia sp.]|nr:outer membrane beta-barrel protein [Emticicia sp.]
MRNILLVTYLLLMNLSVFAQIPTKFSLKATVFDADQKPLENATVLLLSAKDSSLVTFARTTVRGTFELKNLILNDYFIKITFVGYKNYVKIIEKPSTEMVDLGEVKMTFFNNELDAVIVKADALPVQIKGDTVEFNAGSFRTQPNAAVEDLLKKLPGVQVDRDGNITAQGEKVRSITVDGKEFFGKDPKVASQNLPADAIDKVQLFDKKSDQTAFTGIDDGSREKTINLKLKEDRKKMTFGKTTAGMGANERFEVKSNLNRFNKARQRSLLLLGNNVNKQGFSMEDYLNFSGDMQRMMAGGSLRLEINTANGSIPLNIGGRNNGFIRSWAGGVNFNEPFSPKTELNGSYFLNSVNNIIETDLIRQSFLQNRNFSTIQKTIQNNLNTNHRLNFTLDHKIDSLNSIKFISNFILNETKLRTQGESQSTDDKGILQNEGDRKVVIAGMGLNYNANLLFRHKFRKKGRNMTANLTFGINQNNNSGTLSAINSYQRGVVRDTIDQQNSQQNDSQNWGLSLSYSEPIARKKYLELNYSIRENNNRIDRQVYDLGEGERRLNESLSNKFINEYLYNRFGVSYRMVQKKYNFSTGIALQSSVLDGQIPNKSFIVNRRFSNFLPNAHVVITTEKRQNIYFDYETSVREPSLNELNPIPENTDPLRIQIGNPDLIPEYAHRLSLNSNRFNQSNFSSLFLNLSMTYTNNKIATAQTTDDALRQQIKPINVAKDLALNGNFSLGFPIKQLSSKLNINTKLTYNQGINFINNIENTTSRYLGSSELRWQYDFKEFLSVTFGGEVAFNKTQYAISQEFNQSFANQTYFVESNINLPKNWTLSTNFDYLLYASFNQKIPLLNASVAKLFLKNNRAEMKFSVVDALNKNVGINRQANLNFVEDSRVRSLGRYFLVSFTYSLNKPLGGKSQRGMRIIQK